MLGPGQLLWAGSHGLPALAPRPPSMKGRKGGIVKLTNLTLNSPSEEVCQRRRLSGKFLTKGFIM
jgi:hypothetical protein